jgi:hypothetical protein
MALAAMAAGEIILGTEVPGAPSVIRRRVG